MNILPELKTRILAEFETDDIGYASQRMLERAQQLWSYAKTTGNIYVFRSLEPTVPRSELIVCQSDHWVRAVANWGGPSMANGLQTNEVNYFFLYKDRVPEKLWPMPARHEVDETTYLKERSLRGMAHHLASRGEIDEAILRGVVKEYRTHLAIQSPGKLEYLLEHGLLTR